MYAYGRELGGRELEQLELERRTVTAVLEKSVDSDVVADASAKGQDRQVGWEWQRR